MEIPQKQWKSSLTLASTILATNRRTPVNQTKRLHIQRIVTMYQLSSSPLLKASYRQLSPDQNMVQEVELNASHEREVMDFLARRPIHTEGTVGLIYDNGLCGP